MRWLAMLPLVVLLGCEFTIPSGRYACQTSAACPPGMQCVSGLCVTASTVDGGRHDAGRSDGGRHDAGHRDAGHRDAGLHDAGADIDARVPLDAADLRDSGEIPDAEAGDGGLGCDLVAQTGCGEGEKCALVELRDEAAMSRCVPAGTVPAHGDCVTVTSGGITYDSCAPGLHCIGETAGVCMSYCHLESDSCGAWQICSRYEGISDTEVHGVCDLLCEPLSQVRGIDGAPACGSPNPATPSRGCYGIGPFTCGPVLPESAGLVHDDIAYAPHGFPFINSCSPGHLPLTQDPVTGENVCGALCRPATTHPGSPSGAQGVVGSGFTCPERGSSTAECRFIHLFQHPSLPDYRTHDTVGYCYEYTRYTYDHDNDPSTPETPLPSCTTVTAADSDGNGVADDVQHGCRP